MAKKINFKYGRQSRQVVIVWFHGVPLDRETELDATHCDFCGKSREERYTAFYSYDDEDWEDTGEIQAFCNLNCYGGFIATGRMSRARQALMKRALEALRAQEAKEIRDARKSTARLRLAS